MLINTVPDDCLMYIGLIYFNFNITSIVNVFMLNRKKKTTTKVYVSKTSKIRK